MDQEVQYDMNSGCWFRISTSIEVIFTDLPDVSYKFLRQVPGKYLKLGHKFSDPLWYDIFVNCIWVVTRWQYTFTHKQYIEQ